LSGVTGKADGSAREALGMLLIPDENGKIMKSIEYFNTVSTLLSLLAPISSSIPLLSRPGPLGSALSSRELIVDGDIPRFKITPFQRDSPTYRNPI
jgi:hypothetical protein